MTMTRIHPRAMGFAAFIIATQLIACVNRSTPEEVLVPPSSSPVAKVDVSVPDVGAPDGGIPTGPTEPVSFSLIPSTLSLEVGSRFKFDTFLQGTEDKDILFSVEGTNAGTIDADGTYHAPSAPGEYRVFAARKA